MRKLYTQVVGGVGNAPQYEPVKPAEVVEVSEANEEPILQRKEFGETKQNNKAVLFPEQMGQLRQELLEQFSKYITQEMRKIIIDSISKTGVSEKPELTETEKIGLPEMDRYYKQRY